MAPLLRIFLSSPGDVQQERLRAHLVIQKLARDYSRFFAIDSFLWEYEPMLASQHFQDATDPPSTFEIVVLVLWSRLGTPLPEKTAVREYRGIDGRAPVTGTEWEFEDALRANRAHGGKGPPDLLAYRRIGGAKADLDDAAVRDEKIKQYDAMEAFWRRWFRSGEQLLAGFCEYQELDEFDHHLEVDLAKLIERRIKERSLAKGALLWLKGSPFRGLAAYDFADAPVFFGRDGETREGVTRLAEIAGRGAAFLLVTGASGAGKSSLARAGLLPALVATKAVANVGLWRRVVMRPGDAGGEPILALARALITGDRTSNEGLAELAGAYMGAEELAASLAAGGDPSFMFIRTLRALADTERSKRAMLPHEEARLVLLIDQLEELFTRSEIPAEQRTRFAEIIAALARSGVVWVIATIRSDLAYRLEDVKEIGGARFVLMPPDAAQLLEIIRQSARAAGLTFDTDAVSGLGLDAMLAREAAAEPGVLPLLSVMLDDLYARDVTTGASGGVLTVASYHVLGGLRAAVAERAERKMQSLDASDAAAAQALPRVLRALVTTGAAGDTLTVRSVPLATFADGSPERRLVESLLAADARLLTVEDRGRGSELRLAHEALIENWPRAKRIVGESGNFIRVRDDVEAQRSKWEDTKRRREFLLARGVPLAEAEDLVVQFGAELQPALIAYIRASRARADRVMIVVGFAAVVFLFLSSFAGLKWYDSNAERSIAVEQRDKALIAVSRQLTDQSREQLRAGNPVAAMLLALEALPDPDQKHPLHGRPYFADAQKAFYEGMEARTELEVAPSRDGSFFAVRLLSGKECIYSQMANIVSAACPHATPDRVDRSFGNSDEKPLILNRNATRLVTIGKSGISLWDYDEAKLISQVPGVTDDVESASINNHGTLLLVQHLRKNAGPSGSDEITIDFVDLVRQQLVELPKTLTADFKAMTFAEDADAYTVLADSSIFTCQPPSICARSPIPFADRLESRAFTNVHFLQATGALTLRLGYAPPASGDPTIFYPGGNFISKRGNSEYEQNNYSIVVLRKTADAPLEFIEPERSFSNNDDITGVTFANSNTEAYLTYLSGLVRVIPLDGKPEASRQALGGHIGGIADIAYDKDKHTFSTYGPDGTIRFWNKFPIFSWDEELGVSRYTAPPTEDGSEGHVNARVLGEILSNENDGFQEQIKRLLALPDFDRIAKARQDLPRCLHPTERLKFGLDPEPPVWCVSLAKWPYVFPDWKGTLARPSAACDWTSPPFQMSSYFASRAKCGG